VADPVFGLLGLADDIVAAAPRSRIVAKADQFRHMRHLVDQTDIIKIENAATSGLGGQKILECWYCWR
jgi:hypothetical protein